LNAQSTFITPGKSHPMSKYNQIYTDLLASITNAVRAFPPKPN